MEIFTPIHFLIVFESFFSETRKRCYGRVQKCHARSKTLQPTFGS